MKFHQSKLSPYVWDKENNRMLARFENKRFETQDKRVIDILTEKGYESHEPLPDAGEDGEFRCAVCGKVCANALGLNSHMRSHAVKTVEPVPLPDLVRNGYVFSI